MQYISTSIVAVIMLAGASQAETFLVCASGCEYTSINDAIKAASDGDTIQLLPETYFEGAVIDTLGKKISIEGDIDEMGTPLSILDGAGTHGVLQCISGETSETVFTDLIIQNGSGSEGSGLFAMKSNPKLVGCRFRENPLFTIYSRMDFELNGGLVTLENCIICSPDGPTPIYGAVNLLGLTVIDDCIDQGDLNGDGQIDALDLSALHDATGICRSDVDHNGTTDINDLLRVVKDGWGSGGCP